MNEIEAAFAPLASDERWGNPGGLSDERLAALEAELGRPVPEPIRRLLRYTASSEWSGPRPVQFFGYHNIRDVNQRMPPRLQGLFAFASDAGSKDYLLDEEGRLGKGAGAIFSVPAGAPLPSMLKFIAPDLPAFIGWMAEEEED
jgi:hypothetical protein